MTQLPTLAHEERDALTYFLQAQRVSVLAIVEGLGEEQMRRSAVPSGWTALGMLGHLRDAERHWFEVVIAGSCDELEDEDIGDPYVCDQPIGDMVARYREQSARSDEIVASMTLEAAPAGRVRPMADEIHTVRDVVLHMIEETARHAGHLDIARELIDGGTGLGPR